MASLVALARFLSGVVPVACRLALELGSSLGVAVVSSVLREALVDHLPTDVRPHAIRAPTLPQVLVAAPSAHEAAIASTPMAQLSHA